LIRIPLDIAFALYQISSIVIRFSREAENVTGDNELEQRWDMVLTRTLQALSVRKECVA